MLGTDQPLLSLGFHREAVPAAARMNPSLSDAHPVVLVADDEAVIRTVLVDALFEADFRTMEACNAAEAFELLQTRDDIDALMTDVEMPGHRLARRGWPHLAIIVMSGRPLADGHELPERSVFRPKPFDTSKLVIQFREMVAACRPLRGSA